MRASVSMAADLWFLLYHKSSVRFFPDSEMHTWLNKKAASSSSSPSPSPSSSSKSQSQYQFGFALKQRRRRKQQEEEEKEVDGGGGFKFFNTGSLLFGQKRRLTRQRKIRHLSDRDLGLGDSDRVRAQSLPVSPDSCLGSPSPGCLEHWSLSAVPQPLPLPELCRRERVLGGSDHHPNSPREGPPSGCDGTGEGPSSSTRFSYFGGQATRKKTNCVATKAAMPSSISSNGCSLDANLERANYNLRLDIPSRSAPSSGYTSPALTPRRLCTGDWSSSAVPQPLPLPEFCRREGDLGGFDHHPNSPREGPLNGCDGTGEAPSSSTFMSYFGCQSVGENTGQAASISVKPLSNHSDGFSLDLNVESSNYKLRLDIPSRSAPSSPALSPQRFGTGDFFSSSYVTPHKSKIQSPVRNAFSLNNSPLPSPALRSPSHNPPSLRGTTFQLQNRFLPESNAAWQESRNVHPLPLPPGALGSPQSANIHHTLEKPRVSSMKNQWQKGTLIGRGTFGSVYVATNRVTGALCAMKEVDIIPDDPKSAECIRQLEQEIEVLSQLEHPNIVQYYGSEIVGDHFCIYLEYVYPGSINKYIRQYCGAMTESVLRNFTRHIVNGLAYLHSTNTIHRDIKGANLLVDAAGIVKLADFGVAKHLTGQAYDLSLRGSPYWMAPEVMQATMLRDANPGRAFAVDIWSLGCTVIEMLNGKPPWSELEAHAAMFKVLNKTPPIPDALSWEGKDFLRSCFRRNPKERPSAKMLLDHPFLRNPHEYNVSQAISEIKLVEKAESPGDWAKQKTDLKPTSPGTCILNKNIPCNGETSRQCYAENSNSAIACRHSPPVIRALPVLSLQQSDHSSPNIIPSANGPNSMERQTMSYHPYTLLRTHGREVPHL